MLLSSFASWRYPCTRSNEENQLLLWTAGFHQFSVVERHLLHDQINFLVIHAQMNFPYLFAQQLPGMCKDFEMA